MTISRNEKFDVLIIGAGAAGLMCALSASKRKRKILLVDHNKKVGQKIRISGGGRCNFTNIYCSKENFLSQNQHFCVSALKRFVPQDFINLVKKHEISFHEKTLGQLFCDGSSQQIIDLLIAECEESVEFSTEAKVGKIRKNDEVFLVEINGEIVICESLVIATGGPAIPKMGATSFGYEIARQFGLKIIQPIPALVPLTFDETLLLKTKLLSGVSLDAIVGCGKVKFSEAVLFTHRGISGPAILQISSYWNKGQEIVINFSPKIDIYEYLKEEKSINSKQAIQVALAKILPKSFSGFILEQLGFSGNLSDSSNQKLKQIGGFINDWKFIPSGTEGFSKAEVAAGGINSDEISSKTFESKKMKGLFFVGEVLDVTGHLGGHNFQWAWASGNAAGEFV
ncbi:MAG: putative Rossmann fold flavoprotein [Lentimonas sp.]|jgi:predicted Rossmann fold flavoprotein